MNQPRQDSPAPPLRAAYAECRRIARREAKNFYYSFLALPRAKRDAMCAVYAFMRRADDISDDDTLPRAERRRLLAQWLDAWHQAAAGASTADPIFLALRDTRTRFRIPDSLFDQLVHGTALDLDRTDADIDRTGQPGDALDTWATFADLYRYCYLVASVVGLVCIRIFGYTDPRAEQLAEETGIAFQLTNILRDVREDAGRGRIYLPLDELHAAGLQPQDFRVWQQDADLPASARELFAQQAARARHYYRSADALLPLIEADSRPALEVLVTIYRRLLDRIESRHFAVFSERVSVPTAEKWSILLKGVGRMLAQRLRAPAAQPPAPHTTRRPNTSAPNGEAR